MTMASTDMTEDDIELLRKQYEQNMNQCYLNKPFSGPWTRNWVRDIKKMIKFSSKLRMAQKSLYHKYVKDKYYVLLGDTDDGQLILKTPGDDLCIPALPWEDAFDVIWKAHVQSGHGNVTQTMDILRTQYFIEKSCVYCVVALCRICKQKSDGSYSNIEAVYNKVASLQMVDMSTMPDGQYMYLFIYTDLGTSLVQLRACMELTSAEVILKLIDIFTDLGLPKILRVHDTSINYSNVIETVNKIFEPCQITLEKTRLPKRTTIEIKNMISEWMEEENSGHWEIGCYALQWKINNIKTLGTTPHQLVFENNGLKRSIINTETFGSGPSRAEGLPDDYLPVSQIYQFEKPVMLPSDKYYKPTTSMYSQVHTNIYDNVFVIEEDPLKDDIDTELNDTVGVKRKAYINKKVVNRKQNVKKEYIRSESDCMVIKTEPQSQDDQDSPASSSRHPDITKSVEPDSILKVELESQLMQDSCASSSGHPNITNCAGIKLEIPSGGSDGATCRECNTVITSEPYNCIKCLKTIHYECGEMVIGNAVDDPIVCWTCERKMKNLFKT